MGYKSVCTNCRKAYSQGADFEKSLSVICPECQQSMFFVNEKFKPPKKTAKKEWEIVKTLLKGGYDFQSFYQEIYPNNNFVSFPTKLNEVEIFLKAFKNKMR